MKPTLAFLVLSFGVASAFQVAPVSRTSSALGMGGFLDGKGKRITIRDDEDSAMWIEDKKAPGGRVPSEPKKKEEPKKTKPKSGGFKFPWDK